MAAEDVEQVAVEVGLCCEEGVIMMEEGLVQPLPGTFREERYRTDRGDVIRKLTYELGERDEDAPKVFYRGDAKIIHKDSGQLLGETDFLIEGATCLEDAVKLYPEYKQKALEAWVAQHQQQIVIPQMSDVGLKHLDPARFGQGRNNRGRRKRGG